MEPDVLVSVEKSVGILALNRPKKLHTLTLDMVKLISPPLQQWEHDQSIDCLVMHSNPWGSKAFCAGGDVRAVYDEGLVGGPEHGNGIRGLLTADFFREEYQMNHLISTFPHPQVTYWDGIVMGGGVGLSAHGMFRIATERTMFAMPETAIGLFPDVGMTHILPQLRRPEGETYASPYGMYIGLTGVRLNGNDLLYTGLATHGIPSAQLETLTTAIVNAESRSPESISALLSEFQAAGNACNESASSLIAIHDAIERCFSKDTVEEIVEALEAETQEAEWAQKTLNLLKVHSPTSMKVTHRLLREHATKTFEESLRMEYRIAQRFMRNKSDFFEGIRAVLIDRNDPPARWAPSSLEEVTDEMVDEFFAPLPEGNELEYLK